MSVSLAAIWTLLVLLTAASLCRGTPAKKSDQFATETLWDSILGELGSGRPVGQPVF